MAGFFPWPAAAALPVAVAARRCRDGSLVAKVAAVWRGEPFFAGWRADFFAGLEVDFFATGFAGGFFAVDFFPPGVLTVDFFLAIPRPPQKVTRSATIIVMKHAEIQSLAERFLRSELSDEDFTNRMLALSSAQGPVTLDLDRARRCGFPEVVYGEGKSVEILVQIFRRLLEEGQSVLATRIDANHAAALKSEFATGCYNRVARTFRIATAIAGPTAAPTSSSPRVAVITAGTCDLPVAEEARETLDWMGVDTVVVHDVGVAGPHRLPAHLGKLRGIDAAVVVAGLEGALPSVVGGYLDCPVIAVPTSVGYGASFGGLAALLGMLNSCASNVTVVNIDAGFKGAYVAGMIATRAHRRGDS